MFFCGGRLESLKRNLQMYIYGEKLQIFVWGTVGKYENEKSTACD